MGTTLPFAGDPAKTLYAPARGEVDYDDELLATLTSLAAHKHNDATGGQDLDYSAVGDIAALGTASAGVAEKPARGDHRHAHGNLAGTSYHSDYSTTSHVHAGYSLTGHTHTIDEITSGTLWELTTDATYGDNLRSTITDPGTNETAFVIKESLMGAVQLIHGGSGAADDAGSGLSGPSFNFIQRNALPDGSGVDQLANGVITATASPSERWGDEGTEFTTFTYTRGDSYIYFKRYESYAVLPTTDSMWSWRRLQASWNLDYTDGVWDGTYSKPKLASLLFGVYPGGWTPLTTDRWPAHMELNEDGDLTVRNNVEFGGHRLTIGTNNVDGGPQTGYVNPTPTAENPTGAIRSTILSLWGTPLANDTSFATLYFLPDMPGRVGPVLPAGSVSANGYIYGSVILDVAYFGNADYQGSIYCDWPYEDMVENRANGCSLAYFHDPSLEGYTPDDEGGSNHGTLMTFSPYRNQDGVLHPSYGGLASAFGGKFVDFRMAGESGVRAEVHIARGRSDQYGGGNELGNLIWSNTDYGFGWETAPHARWTHWADVSIAQPNGSAMPSDWLMGAHYGITLEGRGATGSRNNLIAIDVQDLKIGTQGRYSHVGPWLLSGGQLYFKSSGHWYGLFVGPSVSGGGAHYAYFDDYGTSLPA